MNLNSLVTQYTSGNVVPILGCELFKVRTRSKQLINIHEYIIEEAFQPSDEWPLPPKMLSELPLAVPELTQNNIIGILNEILDKDKDLSLLTKIAMLKHFKVFIIASFFKEFEQEFIKENPGEKIEIFKNSLDGNHNLSNIDFSNGKRKLIYLFDNIDSERFALNDGELLESIYGLSSTSVDISKKPLPASLFGKTLLFIGCDFSDWFMRYCIRVLYNMPFDRPQRTYIINDNPPKITYQEFFFKTRHINLLQTSPVNDFIDTFWNMAMNRQRFKNKFKDSRLFICYSEHDKNIAQDLCSFLRKNGVDAWFDEEDKNISSHIETIRESIWNPKTKILVSIISKELVNSLSNAKNYVRDIEWDTAIVRLKAAKYRNVDDSFFIVPYYVDNYRQYDKAHLIPEEITDQFIFGELYGGFAKLFSEVEKIL